MRTLAVTMDVLGATSSGRRPPQVPIDPNGNLASKTEGSDNWTYTWNAENELTKVEKNGAEQARFRYDPLGGRVEKVAGGVTTSYTYDALAILREVKGGTTLKYVHELALDSPLAREDGTNGTYFHRDGLGSVVKRSNQAGIVVQEYRYDAWGNIEAGANEPGYAFTGRELDPETGLYYYRARYYDPQSGRFISEDPLRFDGGSNFYLYVDGQPVTLADPLGLTGKGERGCAAKPSGTDNEFKHMKPHPTDPNKVKFRDPHTGKEYDKPKPPGFDPWWASKHPPRNKSRDNFCMENPMICYRLFQGFSWYTRPPLPTGPPPGPFPPPAFPWWAFAF